MSGRWVQLGGAAGVAGVVVAASTFAFAGSGPKSSASAVTIGDFMAAHQGAYKATGLMVVLGAAILMWFIASYAWVLHREEPETPLGLIALLAGAGFLIVLTLDGIVDVALAFVSTSSTAVHSAVMLELYQLDSIVMPGAAGFVAAVLLAVVAVAAWRGSVGARWLGYLSGILAVLSAAGSVAGLTSVDGGSSSPVSFAPATGTSIVVLILGVVMMRWSASPVAAELASRASAAAPV